jgi:hypothetical protein
MRSLLTLMFMFPTTDRFERYQLSKRREGATWAKLLDLGQYNILVES